MVKSRLSFALLLSLFASSQGLAQDDDEEPDPVAWYHEVFNTKNTTPANIIQGIGYECRDKLLCAKWRKVLPGVNRSSYLRLFPEEILRFSGLLNPGAPADVQREMLENNPAIQMQLEDTGTSVNVKVRTMDKFEEAGTWKIKDRDRASSDATMKWLSKNLGYHAVVLDVRGAYLLVGLNDPKRQGKQGVVLRDSSTATIVSRKAQKGKALIQAGRTTEYLAVFMPLVGKDGAKETVVAGDKIMFKKGTDD